MQAKVFAAVEILTVLGFSVAATALLAAGVAGAVKPAAGNPASYTAAPNEATEIIRLPAITVIGSRLAAGEQNAVAVANAAMKRGG